MPWPKPWELDDEFIEEHLSSRTIYVEKMIVFDDSCMGQPVYRFKFYISLGTLTTYLQAAFAQWFKNATGAECGLHYFIQLEHDCSKASWIECYREDDAAVFRLRFGNDDMLVEKEEA